MTVRFGFTPVLAAAALASVALFAQPADAAIANKAQCAAAVTDTQAAAKENPALGDKFQSVFEQLVTLAESRCADSQFVYADQLLTLARTMVVAE